MRRWATTWLVVVILSLLWAVRAAQSCCVDLAQSLNTCILIYVCAFKHHLCFFIVWERAVFTMIIAQLSQYYFWTIYKFAQITFGCYLHSSKVDNCKFISLVCIPCSYRLCGACGHWAPYLVIIKLRNRTCLAVKQVTKTITM